MIVDEACVCIADHSQATSTTPFQFLYKHGMLTHSYTNAMIQTHDLCVKTCHYLLTYAPWVSRCFHICQYPNWEPDKHSSLYKPQHVNILTGSVSLYYYCDITWMQSNVWLKDTLPALAKEAKVSWSSLQAGMQVDRIIALQVTIC